MKKFYNTFHTKLVPTFASTLKLQIVGLGVISKGGSRRHAIIILILQGGNVSPALAARETWSQD